MFETASLYISGTRASGYIVPKFSGEAEVNWLGCTREAGISFRCISNIGSALSSIPDLPRVADRVTEPLSPAVKRTAKLASSWAS